MPQATQPPPKPIEPHHALKVWVGNWHVEGISAVPDDSGSPRANATAPWKSDEQYEMLDGDYFLVQRWKADVGGAPFNGLGVIGYDDRSGAYVARSFENHGYYRNYTVKRQGNTWTFEGDTERARYDFSDDGTSCLIHWEFKPDGKTWQTLCDRTARKVS
jgi:hypothetical protein